MCELYKTLSKLYNTLNYKEGHLYSLENCIRKTSNATKKYQDCIDACADECEKHCEKCAETCLRMQ